MFVGKVKNPSGGSLDFGNCQISRQEGHGFCQIADPSYLNWFIVRYVHSCRGFSGKQPNFTHGQIAVEYVFHLAVLSGAVLAPHLQGTRSYHACVHYLVSNRIATDMQPEQVVILGKPVSLSMAHNAGSGLTHQNVNHLEENQEEYALFGWVLGFDRTSLSLPRAAFVT